MTGFRNVSISLAFCLLSAAAGAEEQKPFEPFIGQSGKDVIWVPTPESLVDKMLDMARVTPKDYVIDLGSGDGRNVIAAAKRGARALGVEFNPDMVELSQRNAAAAGVAASAKFVEGDMFAADISGATVLALFLLPGNLEKLIPKFLELEPGTRIINNGYRIPGWEEEEHGVAGGDCGAWCSAYLYLVPAKMVGTWRFPWGEARVEQDYQSLGGTFLSEGGPRKLEGRVNSDRVRFTVGMDVYTGRVRGDRIDGEVTGGMSGRWTATRMSR